MSRQMILTIDTMGQGLYEFTDRVQAFVRASGEASGLLTLFVRAHLLLAADPGECRSRRAADLLAFFRRLAPPADDPAMGYLVHRAEGPGRHAGPYQGGADARLAIGAGDGRTARRSAPGRASICSSIARGRIDARSCCI